MKRHTISAQEIASTKNIDMVDTVFSSVDKYGSKSVVFSYSFTTNTVSFIVKNGKHIVASYAVLEEAVAHYNEL